MRQKIVTVHTGLCSVCPRDIHLKVRKKVIPEWANPIRKANLRWIFCPWRAAFAECEMCFTVCGVQIAEMIFQTRSNAR